MGIFRSKTKALEEQLALVTMEQEQGVLREARMQADIERHESDARRQAKARRDERRHSERKAAEAKQREAQREQRLLREKEEAEARASEQQRQQEEAREKERLNQKRREARQQQKLKQTTPEALRGLKDLIRQRYQLDIEIWALRGSRGTDRPIVLEMMGRADAVLAEIRAIVGSWENDKDLWTPEEWERVKKIRTQIKQEGKREWAGNPPWNEA